MQSLSPLLITTAFTVMYITIKGTSYLIQITICLIALVIQRGTGGERQKKNRSSITDNDLTHAHRSATLYSKRKLAPPLTQLQDKNTARRVDVSVYRLVKASFPPAVKKFAMNRQAFIT